jgi:hypothetical protein
MLLIVIVALCVALVIEHRRAARLETQVRSSRESDKWLYNLKMTMAEKELANWPTGLVKPSRTKEGSKN